MYFIYIVLNQVGAREQKVDIYEFVVGGEVVHDCIRMCLGVGRVSEERKVLKSKTRWPAVAQEGGAACGSGIALFQAIVVSGLHLQGSRTQDT